MFRTIILSVIISLFSALNLDAATGDVSTVAGSGEAGMFGGGPKAEQLLENMEGGWDALSGDGGPATEALLNNPQGISIDADGNLFIADQQNHRIRRVDSDGTITTVAGIGLGWPEFSGDGGPATEARIFGASDVFVAGNGDIYIADMGNNRIRKVDGSGVISTVAGNGVEGFSGDGGPATDAALAWPQGVFVGSEGVIFIADKRNHRIRRVDLSGTISTIAGSGSSADGLGEGGGGFSGDGGPATEALLDTPEAVAVGPDGAVYIADRNNNRIRRVNNDGTIETFAGSGDTGPIWHNYSDGGPATEAKLDAPTDVIVTEDGVVYISDYDNDCVRRVDTDGNITTVVGYSLDEYGSAYSGFSGDGGPATDATFSSTRAVALDSEGNLYVTDNGNSRVRRIEAIESAGADQPSTPGDSTVVDGTDHEDVLEDVGRGEDSGGDVSTTVAGSGGEAGYVYTLVGSGDYGKSDHGDSKFYGDGGDAMDAVMNQPRGVAVGSENDLFIADYKNSRIRMVDPAEGTIETVAGGGDLVQDSSSEYDGALATAVAFYPAGICFGRDGNLYVTTYYDEVLKVNSDGIITWVAGDYDLGYALGFSGDGGPATEAGLSYPTGVFAYSDGTVLIADRDHNRIRRVDPDGTISTIAGSGPADSGGFSGDGGPATEAMLYGPSGVTVGPGGEIYIADTYNHRIRKVDTDGTISTVAGSGPDGAEEGSFGGDGGPATLANLSVPINVIVTNEGTIYITDSYNHCIRRVDTAGNIDTVVGDNQAGFSGDGNPATTAQFYFPEGIAFDSEGNLYIADSWNHRVRAVMALESAGAVVVGGTVAKTPEEAANFDGDATVGFGDFLVFAGGFGSQSSDDGFDPRLDLDGDGAVGFGDFLMFAAVFGQTI